MSEKYTKTVYIYDGKEFDGTGIEISDAKSLLSATFPEIANSETKEEIKDGVRRITFTKVAGTKGATSVLVAKKLANLKECDFLGKTILKNFLNQEPFNLEAQIEELENLDKQCIQKKEKSEELLNKMQYLEPKKVENVEGI